MICLTTRSDQNLDRTFLTTPISTHMRVMILTEDKKVREGSRNVPQPPSPQMVIEILSAIAWPTTMMRGRQERRSGKNVYTVSSHRERHRLGPGVLDDEGRKTGLKYEKERNGMGDDNLG